MESFAESADLSGHTTGNNLSAKRQVLQPIHSLRSRSSLELKTYVFHLTYLPFMTKWDVCEVLQNTSNHSSLTLALIYLIFHQHDELFKKERAAPNKNQKLTPKQQV